MSSSKKVLFVVPYPQGYAPSQRFRVENFLPLLERHQIAYTVSSFLDEETYTILYKPGHRFKKLAGLAKGFLRRFKTVLWDASHYDFVFVHREASPAGPPIFEWVLARLWRKKMIYDFDDAVWIPDTGNKLVSWLKATWKIKWICKWAYKVAAGNDYLSRYAHQVNTQVVLLPTCVDVVHQHNRLKEQKPPVVIGWTGSHSTLRYLQPLVPLLQEITDTTKTSFLVISNRAPDFSFPGLKYLPWRKATEVSDLLGISIGIMPLENDLWSEGKCGFKLIQYLSLGIPAVASPVGVNRQIITSGVDGYLCSTLAEWRQALSTLVENEQVRGEMGKRGREKMVTSFSVQAYEETFLSSFA